MRGVLRRRAADLVCRALTWALPPSLRPWGWAIRYEAAALPDATNALTFAISSALGLGFRTIGSRLASVVIRFFKPDVHSKGELTVMKIITAAIRRPRVAQLACAIGAVMLGVVYMALAGAPERYMVVNVGALVVGLVALALIKSNGRDREPLTDWAMATIACALLATAFLGDAVDGSARWVGLGGLSVQPSLVLLPAMVVAFGRRRSVGATLSVVAAATALAIQPDRAMAGMLLAGVAMPAIRRPDRSARVAFGAAAVAFAVTLARADRLPAEPYVDQILYSSFALHPLAGAAVWGGSALLIMPVILGWRCDAANRDVYAAFGAAWLAAIAAAALGNYPTPIVGYGGSAIIGYLLSLATLLRSATAFRVAEVELPREGGKLPLDRHLHIALA